MRPTLFVSNHISYLDINVYGSIIRGFNFVAKSEVAGYSIFGWLAQKAGTIFVKRVRTATKSQADILSTALKDGQNLLLFAEELHQRGWRILPLKPSLLESAKHEAKSIQMAIIKYTHFDHFPMDYTDLPFVGWYGDIELTPHIWQLFKSGYVRVRVEFFGCY